MAAQRSGLRLPTHFHAAATEDALKPLRALEKGGARGCRGELEKGWDEGGRRRSKQGALKKIKLKLKVPSH